MDNLTEEGKDVANSLVQQNIQLLILRGVNHLAALWDSLLEGVIIHILYDFLSFV